MIEHIICAVLWIIFTASLNVLITFHGIDGEHVGWYVALCTIMFVCCCIISWQAMLTCLGIGVIGLIRRHILARKFIKKWNKGTEDFHNNK